MQGRITLLAGVFKSGHQGEVGLLSHTESRKEYISQSLPSTRASLDSFLPNIRSKIGDLQNVRIRTPENGHLHKSNENTGKNCQNQLFRNSRM